MTELLDLAYCRGGRVAAACFTPIVVRTVLDSLYYYALCIIITRKEPGAQDSCIE
jgi:hypothetical protein